MRRASPAGTLIGRDSEMALLAGLVKQAVRGHGSSVLIEGEPGIGKSALVRTAVAEASEVGCQVFWGAGDELSLELPLQPFIDGLRLREPSVNPRRNTIVQLLRGEAIAEGMDVPAVLAEQLLALVAEQCAVRPTILVVDDLQWTDPASIALWARLATSAEQMRLLLAGIMRPVPKREDLLALRRVVSDTAFLQLTGLPGPAVHDLVAKLAGGEPDGNLLQLADGAAGNPLYITELVAALVRSSGLTVTGTGTVALVDGSAPSSLSAAIADRLGFVAGPVREVLRAAALLGADFAVPDLAIVLHRTVPDLIPAVEEACAAGVLAESGQGLGFRHPLIRAALYDEVSAPVRAAWHREAGHALVEAGAPVDRVARQILRAVGGFPEPMDEWMLDWLTRTGDSLVDLAPGVAADLLARAVASSRGSSPRHVWLASRLADALYRMGDRVQAEQVATYALEHATEPEVLVDLHWTLAQCRMLEGTPAESAQSLATLDRAVTSLGISARHRARLLVLAARTHVRLGELDKGVQVATRALAEASEAGDNWAKGWAFHVMALVSSVQGHEAEALPIYDRALAVTGSDLALSDLRLLLQINMAIALANLDRHTEALAAAAQARNLAGQVGTVVRLTQAHGALGQLLFVMGRWSEALTELQMLNDSLKDPAAACGELSIAAVIRFHRGETGAARRHLAAANLYAELADPRLIGPLTLARSLDREQDGALPEALAVLTDRFDDSTEELAEADELLADTVRLALQVGNQSAAQSAAARAAIIAEGSEVPHRQASVLYCRGLLDRDAPGLLEAAARYGDASMPLWQAKALEAAADCFVHDGDLSQARAAFNGAVDVYTLLGAAADIARLQAVFRVYGIRRGSRAKHRQAQSGWASLTPAEIKIAAMVEEGLSNPEIAASLMLSPRTVGTHVSHILKKLGVHTRTDIARESVLRTIAPN
jgi:DNA-binding CsgD family transcriptional regulator/tetratricopeptide (TPR) repeat protein